MSQLQTDIKRLKNKLADVSEDLAALEALLAVDVPSSLNKIRFITEKVLQGLCKSNGVSWGQAEPTLERMIGPLVATDCIPKSVAIHVRTIQINTSPGSHYQESAMSAAHIGIAQHALLEFLEWHCQQLDGLNDHSQLKKLPMRSPQAARRVLWVTLIVLLCLAGGGLITFVILNRQKENPTDQTQVENVVNENVVKGASSKPVFIQTYFHDNQLRLLRCESSPWRQTSGVPGPTDFLDRRKLKRALSEILSVIYYTTVDRVAIGEFMEHDGQFDASVTLLDSNLADKKSYHSAHLEIGERELSISLFSENGQYYRVKNLDELAWDVLRIKNGIRSYLEASVSNWTDAESFIGELQKQYNDDGSGHLFISFIYKRAK